MKPFITIDSEAAEKWGEACITEHDTFESAAGTGEAVAEDVICMQVTSSVKDALWQMFYHGELDDLAHLIEVCAIDGNDHPALLKAAEALQRRLT